MDCDLHTEFGSPAYLSEVVARACRDRAPMNGSFDLTYRCNFRCVHCYCGHLVGQTRSQAAEIETKQALGLLSEAARAGCLMLLLSGGEPLLREDFIQIYTAARRLGFVVTVFTNASLVTQAHVDTFEEYPPEMVEVSVYGATEATYERITGVPGSFRRTRRGIEQLMARGIRVGLKTMILRDNVDEIGAIEALARDLGLRFRLDPLITARLDGDQTPLEQRVDAQRAVYMELASGERRKDLRLFFRRQQAAGAPGTGRAGELYYCGAGIASFHIDPRGLMHPCLLSPAIAYNAVTMGFDAAWKAVTAATDDVTWDGAGGCSDCPTIDLCGYCPGVFALEKASPFRPPDYLCQLGEYRLRGIGAEEPEVAHVRAK
jgi:radical SAM protein with 4Fe4S-binding SPASM domain